MTTATLHAACYTRVSTLLNQNPELQIAACRDFAERRGFVLAEKHIYLDRGISGKAEKRPALDRMIREAKKGEFSVIIVTKLDRLGRSCRHVLGLIDDLAHWKVSLISLSEQFDMTSSMGRMTLSVLSAVAELERNIISERIRNAVAARRIIAAKQGIPWRTGRPPILTEEVIANVRQLRQQGASTRAVCRQLSLSKGSVQRAIRCAPPSSEKRFNHLGEMPR